MHWGTFVLTDEALDEPPRALARAVEAAGEDPLRMRLPAIGERWLV
jgi:N-acyl-phosphatidylethanolamine-hydrolysing phospholipase D